MLSAVLASLIIILYQALAVDRDLHEAMKL